MKLFKKLLFSSMIITIFLFTFTGCKTNTKLPEGFDEETVKTQAIQDIELASSNDYEGWVDRFPKELHGNLTPEIYQSYLDTLDKLGEFQEYGKTAFVGQEQDGKKYAACLMIVKYKNGKLQYTVGYDEDMKLVQFTIK